MLNPYSRQTQNTTISAIGLMQIITPYAVTTGYGNKLSKMLEGIDINNQQQLNWYFTEGKKLKKKILKQGSDVEEEHPHLDFILNPFARKILPKEILECGYTDIYEYSLHNGNFIKAFSWLEQTKK